MSEKNPQQPSEQPGEPGRQSPWNPNEEVGDIYSIELGDDGQIEHAELLRRPRPSVWIACLAAYNNGKLHGEWVEAAVPDEDLVDSAKRILAASPEPDAEEWAIFDYDEFGAFKVGEYESLETVARVARGIAKQGDAFAAWAELHDADPELLDQFEDAFLGEYESEEEWARQVMDEINLEMFLRAGPIPETIRPYIRIDYEAWAHDAMLSGEVHFEFTERNTVYVFAVR